MEEEALKLAEERAPKNEEKEGESTSENATDGSQMVSEMQNMLKMLKNSKQQRNCCRTCSKYRKHQST